MARGRRRSCSRSSSSSRIATWSAGQSRPPSRRSRRPGGRQARAQAQAPARASSLPLHGYTHLDGHPIIAAPVRTPLGEAPAPCDQYAPLGGLAVSELSALSLVDCDSRRVCCVCWVWTSRGGRWWRSSLGGGEALWVRTVCAGASPPALPEEGVCAGVPGGLEGGLEGTVEVDRWVPAGTLPALCLAARARLVLEATRRVLTLVREVDLMRSEVVEVCLLEEPPQAPSASAQSTPAVAVDNARFICLDFISCPASVRRSGKATSCRPERRHPGARPSIDCHRHL
jgi:hypothetical protein